MGKKEETLFAHLTQTRGLRPVVRVCQVVPASCLVGRAWRSPICHHLCLKEARVEEKFGDAPNVEGAAEGLNDEVVVHVSSATIPPLFDKLSWQSADRVMTENDQEGFGSPVAAVERDALAGDDVHLVFYDHEIAHTRVPTRKFDRQLSPMF
ncbi:hypothetical protein ACLOJK_040738 [Asimina triloba]